MLGTSVFLPKKKSGGWRGRVQKMENVIYEDEHNFQGEERGNVQVRSRHA